eukprot:756658-Hanusia_phi.AAC.5
MQSATFDLVSQPRRDRLLFSKLKIAYDSVEICAKQRPYLSLQVQRSQVVQTRVLAATNKFMSQSQSSQ